MRKNILIVFFTSFCLVGCVGTIDTHCKSSTNNFPEGYNCIKNGYSNAYSSNSPVKVKIDEDMKCGEELSNLVEEGKLKNLQAWYLFWHARNFKNKKSFNFVCVDWEYLKDFEQTVKERDQERQGIFND